MNLFTGFRTSFDGNLLQQVRVFPVSHCWFCYSLGGSLKAPAALLPCFVPHGGGPGSGIVAKAGTSRALLHGFLFDCFLNAVLTLHVELLPACFIRNFPEIPERLRLRGCDSFRKYFRLVPRLQALKRAHSFGPSSAHWGLPLFIWALLRGMDPLLLYPGIQGSSLLSCWTLPHLLHELTMAFGLISQTKTSPTDVFVCFNALCQQICSS